MKPIYKQVMDNLGIPDDVAASTKAYCNDNLAVFKPDYLIKDSNLITSYHFVIPLSEMPPLKVDNKLYTLYRNHIFVSNPGQCLSNNKEVSTAPYTAFFIDETYLKQFAYLSCGKSEIVFDNTSCVLNPEINTLITRFMFECSYNQTGHEMVLEAIATEIAILLLRGMKHNASNFFKDSSCIDKNNINRSIEYLMDNYNEEISLQQLSQIANLSPYHFIRVFKSQTGITPYQFLIGIKIHKAMDLLKSSQLSVTEISSRCGFANPSYFAAIFKKRNGITPSRYRKMQSY